MTEVWGVASALIGSVLGGTALAGTRFAVGTLDPLIVASVRYGIGSIFLLPFAIKAIRLLQSSQDAFATFGLSILFFAIYPYTFALALAHTTAVRGSLALSSMPLLTLFFAIVIGREPFLWRRVIGMLIAVGGLTFALSHKIGPAAPSAWQGDLIMVAAATMQSVYNVLSKPYIQRVGPLPFTALGMVIGTVALAIACALGDTLTGLSEVNASGWVALVYLGIFGGAVLWVLWSVGLRYASPSLVALTNTVNTLTASFLGAVFLAEPLGVEFVVGLVCVVTGIALAMDLIRTRPRAPVPSRSEP